MRFEFGCFYTHLLFFGTYSYKFKLLHLLLRRFQENRCKNSHNWKSFSGFAPGEAFLFYIIQFWKAVNQIAPSICNTRKIFLEVKGVTLEDNGVVLFSDALTERGVKHVQELIRCRAEGFETYVLFVVQMEHALYFTPNRKTHPQFADALQEAQKAGVQLLAYTCNVTPGKMKFDKELEIRL